MAQVNTPNNPNDPNNPNNASGTPGQPGAGQQANQPATSSGAGAVTATGAGNVTGQVVGTNNPTQPFQNVSAYLAANAPQSQALAGQVADSVSKPIAQTQSDIQNASDSFSKSVNAGFTPENKDLVNTVASNPTAAVADPNNVSSFLAQLNDSYKGPADFTSAPGYGDLESKVANAQSLGQAAQTPTGIQTLLQGVEGPTTAGVNNLDTLLLSQDPNNFKTIADAGAGANTTNNNLLNFLTTQTGTNNAAAKSAADQAKQAAANAAAGLGTAASRTAGDVQAAYNSAISGTQDYNQKLSAIQSAVLTGNLANLSPDQRTAIGFNPDTLTALSDYAELFPAVTKANMPNLPLYYSGPSSATLPVSAQQVETPEQAAAIAALKQLNGGNSLSALAGLSDKAPSEAYKVPTDFGRYNNSQLADYLYSTLLPTYNQYLTVPAGTSQSGLSPDKINSYMAFLKQFAGEQQPTPPGELLPTSPPLAPPTPPKTGNGGGNGRAFA